ncbi:MAG: hypothetical protein ACWGQW_04520 [bacterium]
MTKIRRNPDPVAQLTGTNNKKEQAAQFNTLVQLANAPVMVIAITFDSRNQRVDAKLVGVDAPNEIIQQVLDAAKNLFNQQEIAKQVGLAVNSPEVNEEIIDAEQDSSHSRREPLEMADTTPEAS